MRRRLFAILLSLVLTCRLFYKAWFCSDDFEVYWKASHRWLLSDINPYSFQKSDHGMIFKYPPWVIPFFSPLGVLDFGVAKIVWGFLELGCLYYCMRWLTRAAQVSWWRSWLIALCFWWIIQDHYYSGQFTLMMLAGSLWSVTALYEERQGKWHALKSSVVGFALSAKIFSLISLAGIKKKWARLPILLTTGALYLVTLGLVLIVMNLNGASISPIDLLHSWLTAAASGGSELPLDATRGHTNHGFVAGILRWSSTQPSQVHWDIFVWAGLNLLFGSLWWKASKWMSWQESWTGWLALGAITHPLVWNHSFVMAYPLCVIAMDRTLKSQNIKARILAWAGICCIGLLNTNIIGNDLVKPLELISIKSWGVCFSGIALTWVARQNKRRASN